MEEALGHQTKQALITETSVQLLLAKSVLLKRTQRKGTQSIDEIIIDRFDKFIIVEFS